MGNHRDSPICGIDRDGLAWATKRAPANNRTVMLIGDGRETNPASEFHAWVESIDDVVGRLLCTGCQGDGTSPNVQSYADHPRKCPLCKGAGFLLVGL